MKKGIVLWSVLLLMFFCACTKQEAAQDTESTLYINQDGSLDSLVVEDFPEEKYAAEELFPTIREIVDVYNQDHGSGCVKLLSCEVKDGQAFVKLHYKTGADYAAFNRTTFFYGSVADGLAAGYGKKATLKNAYGSNMISGDAIADLSSYRMIVTGEPVQIRTYESILYYSANLDLSDDKTGHVSSESGGEAVLIIK